MDGRMDGWMDLVSLCIYGWRMDGLMDGLDASMHTTMLHDMGYMMLDPCCSGYI